MAESSISRILERSKVPFSTPRASRASTEWESDLSAEAGTVMVTYFESVSEGAVEAEAVVEASERRA